MGRYLKLTVLGILLLGCESKKVTVPVPWHISLSDAEFQAYHVFDSIKKYEEIPLENVTNKTQFLSFKANLHAMSEDSISAKRYLRQAIKEDSLAVCQNVVEPLSLYLGNTGPNREKSIPPLLHYDLDYLIDLFYTCGSESVKKRKLSQDDEKLYYTMRYIRIRDHWYRSPLREMDVELQSRLDKENRRFFEKLVLKKAYHQKNYFKGVLMLLVAHSDDIAWTKKWLQFYLNNYVDEPQTPDFIRQFKRRSPLVKNPEIMKILNTI